MSKVASASGFFRLDSVKIHIFPGVWAFFVFRFFCTCKNSCYYLYLISLELVTTESYYYFCVCSKNNKSYMFYGYDFKNQKTDETFGPIVRSRCKPVGCTISMVETSRNHTDQLRKQQVKRRQEKMISKTCEK